MSVTVNLVMQGDLDNPKRRVVCDEITEAIQAVINKHTGNTSAQRIISETKNGNPAARIFDVEASNKFDIKNPTYVEHKLAYYTGFHLNA